ncbi:ATP-binding protein [uncultured Clostridium sp.]|uniref:ATP-binding protein n=1 Tax=uncultured Clostridium sp. TaxID=59620 RepID=UPI00263B22C8|nr:ATP-binding protein [uncultured Clostridium sp.]
MYVLTKLNNKIEDIIVDSIASKFYKRITLFTLEFNVFAESSDNMYRCLIKNVITYICKITGTPHKYDYLDNRKFNEIALQVIFDSISSDVFKSGPNIIRFVKDSSKNNTRIINYDIIIKGLHADIISKNIEKIISRSYTKEFVNRSNKNVIISLSQFDTKHDYSRDIDQFIENNQLPDLSNIFGDGAKSIKKYIEDFINNKNIYDKYNINYSLNLLLSGPAGTGKTSIIRAVLKKYNLQLFVINSNTDIETFITRPLPVRYKAKFPQLIIILFEEIDEIIGNDSKKLEYIMQYLDGIYSKNNVINILTTNHYEKLDSRLVRKGRVDKHIIVDNISYNDAMLFANKFDVPDSVLKNILSELGTDENGRYNPANIESEVIDYIKKNNNL